MSYDPESEVDKLCCKLDETETERDNLKSEVERIKVELKEAQSACNEAWNAFENGKRKHHRDALTGRCILGCQACAIEKLSAVLKP